MKTPENTNSSTDRRSFCKSTVALGFAAAAFAPPVAAGIRTVISATEAKGAESTFYPVAKLDTLTQTPQKFVLQAENVKDGWITYPVRHIGSIYLFLNAENAPIALHSACPHMLCAIESAVRTNPKTQESEPLFFCPCHAASFDLNGERLDEVSQSPRSMDSLELEVRDGTVYVKYEDFLSGVSEKKPKS